MKIRNLKFDELNKVEKKIVVAFWNECVADDELCKNHYPCNNNVMDFWEEHREVDTENGEYEGWIKQV